MSERDLHLDPRMIALTDPVSDLVFNKEVSDEDKLVMLEALRIYIQTMTAVVRRETMEAADARTP